MECGAWVVVVRGGECRGVECWLGFERGGKEEEECVGQAVGKKKRERRRRPWAEEEKKKKSKRWSGLGWWLKKERKRK